MKQTILITGGAGYIGSHIAKHFLSKDFKVVIVDNFFRGYHEAIEALKGRGDLECVEGDILSQDILDSVFANYDISLVIHCAALCYPDESLQQPLEYYKTNTLGTASLLKAMEKAGVTNIIFSSTCAVYGTITKLPVNEEHALSPITPYGLSKQLAEELIQMQARLQKLNYVIFRFFNICGADHEGIIGDSKKPSQLLMQNAVRGALNIASFSYTCAEVETPDKTPVRDYIDVEDLARAHEAACDYLLATKKSAIINLGNGQGYSVKQIIETVEKHLNVSIEKGQGTPRQGEMAAVYADTAKAVELLNWRPIKPLEQSIISLVKWYSEHPQGFKR